MKSSINKLIFSLTVVLLMLLNSCTPGKLLKTESFKDIEQITETFTLILYGGRHSDDLETVAILDIEGDGYEFIPYAPGFDYSTKKGLRSKEAFQKAKDFVSFHEAFWTYNIRKIIGEKGNKIGYEIRPLYMFQGDLLSIDYFLEEGGRVKVNVWLIPVFRNLFFPYIDEPS